MMTTREIAEFLNGELHGDGDLQIYRVADFTSAGDGDIAYLSRTNRRIETNASCVIVSPDADTQAITSAISVDDPKQAFAKLARALYPQKRQIGSVDRTAVISSTASLGENVCVGAFVSVGENSKIGDGTQMLAGSRIGDDVMIGARCVLHSNVVVENGCTIGNDVVLHAGVVIGADGFGYVKDKDGSHLKFPQIGTVVIEDNVEIGANSCVDRGALGETRIGAGTKIDNLVQIAHNVQIGKNCIIVAMSGISGSSVLEDDVVLAGQVGIADHVTLKKGVVIAAKSAVYSNKVISDGVWSGIPARPIKDFNAAHAVLNRIARDRKLSTKEISTQKADE